MSVTIPETPVATASRGVFDVPLAPGCPVWCVSDHRDPLMAGIHVSRTAVFAPPSDLEVDGEFLTAELTRCDDLANPRDELSLNHAGNGVLLDAAAVDETIHGLLEFVVRLKALRAQMDAS